MDKNKILKTAFQRFNKISEESYHYQQKFRFLPNWLNNTSYYFDKEAKNNLPKRYLYYKRGTIVRVNFGTNMGSEFSNIHFAIVLDKKDSPMKRTLTVIPLTSKQKHGRYELGKEIFNQTTTILDNQINEMSKKSQELSIQINQLSEKQSKLGELLKNEEIIADELKIQKLQLEFSNYEQEVNNYELKLNEYAKDIEELEKVFEIYKSYNKNSFVRLSDITTISKLRITKINKFDISGKIRLTENQMKEISTELAKLYLNKTN